MTRPEPPYYATKLLILVQFCPMMLGQHNETFLTSPICTGRKEAIATGAFMIQNTWGGSLSLFPYTKPQGSLSARGCVGFLRL